MKVCKINKTGVQGMTRREVLRLGPALPPGRRSARSSCGSPERQTPSVGSGSREARSSSSSPRTPGPRPWRSCCPEFEKQTGIKVEFAELPELQARQKLTVEFTAGTGGIDAWLTCMHVEKRRFWKSGWYADLEQVPEGSRP